VGGITSDEREEIQPIFDTLVRISRHIRDAEGVFLPRPMMPLFVDQRRPFFDYLTDARGGRPATEFKTGVINLQTVTSVEFDATPDLGWVPDQAPTPWWRRVLKKVRGEVTGD